jgi:hypothetical protein
MNRSLLPVLMSLLGCAEAELATLGQAPPPGSTPEFAVSQITPGDQLRMTWGGLPVGTRVTFAASAAGAGAGPCPPVLGGACLGIRSPIVLGTAVVNGNGHATLVRTAPATLATGTYAFQAAAAVAGTGYVSNVYERATGPGICPLLFDPVCGWDLMTYDNECSAHAQGMTIASWGFCP